MIGGADVVRSAAMSIRGVALLPIALVLACSDPAAAPATVPTPELAPEDLAQPPPMAPVRAADPAGGQRAFHDPPPATLAAAGGGCTLGEVDEAHPPFAQRGRPHVAIAFDGDRGAVAWASRGHVGLAPITAGGARAGAPVEIAGAGRFDGIPAGSVLWPFEGGWLVLTSDAARRYAYVFPASGAPSGAEIDTGSGVISDVAVTPRGLELLIAPDRIVTLRVSGAFALEQELAPITGIGGPIVGQLLADPEGHAWVASTLRSHRIVRPSGPIDLDTDVVSSHARFVLEGGAVFAEWGRDRAVWRVEVVRGSLRAPDRLAPAATPIFAAIDESIGRPQVQRFMPLREAIGSGIDLPPSAAAAGALERAVALRGSAFVLAWTEPDGRGGARIASAPIRCEAAR